MEIWLTSDTKSRLHRTVGVWKANRNRCRILAAEQRNQFTDAESNENAASVTVAARFRRLFEGSLGFSYKRIGLPTGDTPLPATPLSIDLPITDVADPAAQSGVKYGITLGLTRDSRDYFLNPTRGRLDHLAFEFSRGDFKLRKLWVNLRGYYPTWRRQVIAVGLHGAAAWGDNIPPTELFYLGGANTLRGYDEDWFLGPAASMRTSNTGCWWDAHRSSSYSPIWGQLPKWTSPLSSIRSAWVMDSVCGLNRRPGCYGWITDLPKDDPLWKEKSMSISEHRSKKGVLTDDMRFQLLLSGFIKSSQWDPPFL